MNTDLPELVLTPNNINAFDAVEALMRLSHPHADSAAIIGVLRTRFTYAEALLGADSFMLERAGVHPHDALLISKIMEMVRYTAQDDYEKRPKLATLAPAADYLRTNYAGLHVERFYMLCLDRSGRLKANVLLQEGTLDCALFNLKLMLSEIMRLEPAAVVVSHNHPGYTLRPSQEDIDCTLAAIRALTTVGVPLLDHIIIAGEDAVSLRDNGYVPAVLWRRQLPESRLLQNWLSDPIPEPEIE